MGVNLASFKNSRIAPTPATTAAVQNNAVVPPNSSVDPLAPVIPANAHRTYLMIYNRHPTDTFRYKTWSGMGPIPTVAQILASGFDVVAGAEERVVSPEAVFAVSTTANPIPVDTDEGQD